MPAITPAADAIRFEPRILFLSRSPEVVARCLHGKALALDDAMPLRDDVSTDEITPIAILTHYHDKLGRYPYTGFNACEKLTKPKGVLDKRYVLVKRCLNPLVMFMAMTMACWLQPKIFADASPAAAEPAQN